MFDKITDRIKKLCYGLNDLVDAVAMRVIEGLYDGVSTSELDNLAAETGFDDYCASRLCTIKNCDFKSAFQYNKIIFGNNDRNV
jgi:hypothetical protein